jgi:exodeoxyribonuclease-5
MLPPHLDPIPTQATDFVVQAADVQAALVRYFPYEPTEEQHEVFGSLSRFICAVVPRAVLVVNGAAGTGKTTMLAALVRVLEDREEPYVLLAPTGRAARVMGQRSGRAASTVHKHIYSTEQTVSGGLSFRRRTNQDPQRTLYIVDEASMIGEPEGTVNGLLTDLLTYAFAGRPDTRVLFIGDPMQLPPVGCLRSPALDAAYLARHYDARARSWLLNEVRRQALDSTILLNATRLRRHLQAGPKPHQPLPTLATDTTCQVLDTSADMIETYLQYHDPENLDSVMFVVYSNALAGQVNQAIRSRLFDPEAEALCPGDRVMVVRNYYAHYRESLPFIANGDLGIVRYVDHRSLEERYGHQWCRISVEFVDVTGEAVEVEALVSLTLLQSKDPQMTSEQQAALWAQRRTDLEAELPTGTPRTEIQKRLRTDPYITHLQLKYGYAVTAHKAQGGQWDHVLIGFEPYHTQRMLEANPEEFLRWAYTAFTRARTRVYLHASPFNYAERRDEPIDG